MYGKRILFIVINNGRKYIRLVCVVGLLVIIANAIIFAHISNDPLEGKSIIIDPGHGGIDGGTNDGGTFLEKDINLQIAQKLKSILTFSKARVTLTRGSDISLENESSLNASRHRRDLDARVTKFNSGDYEIFISIHVNQSSNSKAMGPMVVYSPKLPKSAALAELMQNRLNEHTKTVLKKNFKHSTFKSDFYILDKSYIPGIIVETGFISNPEEKSLLADESYQLKLAKAICSGIRDYFKSGGKAPEPNQQDAPPPQQQENSPFNIINEAKQVSQ